MKKFKIISMVSLMLVACFSLVGCGASLFNATNSPTPDTVITEISELAQQEQEVAPEGPLDAEPTATPTPTPSPNAGVTGNYLLKVNTRTQVVTALKKDAKGDYTVVVRNMICSTGASSSATPPGTFKTQNKYRWGKLKGDVWGQYCTRINGSILFHSVPNVSASPDTLKWSLYNQLGSRASAGCVRLRVVDALWIYNNCGLGTTVQVGSFNDSFLPGRMSIAKLPSGTKWDPTDPDPRNEWNNKPKPTTSPTPKPSPTVTPKPSPTVTPTPKPTPTPTPTPTPSPSPSPSPEI